MKKEKIISAIIIILLGVLIVLWFLPVKFFIGVKPKNVATIKVFNGTNGNSYEITEREEVEYIVRNIKSVNYRKTPHFGGGQGFLLSITLLDEKGEQLGYIRTGGNDYVKGLLGYVPYTKFSKRICTEYILNIEDRMCNQLRDVPNETLERADRIVKELMFEATFSIALFDANAKMETVYADAKNIVQELSEFETTDSSAVALLTLYEKMLDQAKQYDFAKHLAVENTDEFINNIDQYRPGLNILAEAEVLEALLSLKCYQDQLSFPERKIMFKNFHEFATIITDAETIAYGCKEQKDTMYFDFFSSR